MPSWWEMAIISFVTLVLLALLVSEKGSRLWAVGIAIALWLLASFSVVAMAFISAWYGLVS